MAPNNKEEKVIEDSMSTRAGKELANAPPGEEVCISGASGRFPDSNNIYEFRNNLFNKLDMVTADQRRWTLAHPEIPQRTGKINNIDKFDASFFGVHYKQAHSMDPMCRVLLEKAYETIVDAGVNPLELRGTSTGVFIGACFSESEKTWFYEKLQPYGFGLTGCSRAMLANRISYWLGINGPSYTVDSACSSSLYALEHAYKAIRDGQCDQALVAGTNLCLHPYLSLQFSRLGVLSPQGMCKSFDAQANGYARSEAIGMVFLQKTRNCKRVYATIVHAKTNCDGYKEQGITYPSGQMQQQLLEEFYQECQVDPKTISWMEAHGTGTRVGDPEECNALSAVFCKDRTTPLPIGSVKSNIGHSEPASGICSVTKVIISMECGMIPPNLHYNTPREGVQALIDGTLQVVTEPQAWDGGLVGINSFGFGGANAHVLLRWNPKTKINGGAPIDNLPRLVTISGRTEAAVNQILDDLESRPVDAEYVRLYHDVHSIRTPGHIYRGYTILKPGTSIRHVKYFSSVCSPPHWFILSGLDSQWTGMGKSLLDLPAFASAIERCRQALKPKGIDVTKIITEDKFDNPSHMFVGITAVQIGLIDVLETLCIRPVGLIGHSIGEVAAGYADNCLTVEQAMLIAYYRGQALMEEEPIKGSMVQIDVGCETVQAILPPDLHVACRNGLNSCVVSGPAIAISTLVKALKARGVNTKLIACGSFATHSRCVTSAGPKLIKYLKKVIPNPKTRSPRWLSSSVPESQWKTPLSKLASAEYFSNSLVSPVLFEDVAKHIPSDVILIEISPDGGLVEVLASLQKQAVSIPLMERDNGSIEYILSAIGKLYEAGLEPQLSNLYPPVAFPVSRSTPMISPLIGWEHSQDWYVTSYKPNNAFKSGERGVIINVASQDMEYYKGHVIDGRNLFPATGYLILVWETLALINDYSMTEIAVVFENVRFHRATNLPKEGNVEFIVVIQKASGNFEVVEGGAAIVTGNIYISKDIESEMVDLPPPNPAQDAELIDLSSRDIYKELRLRGYNYSGLFRSILSADNKGVTGKIQWSDNWVAFMDNMLQMQILLEDTRGLFVPTSIEKLSINPFLHLATVRENSIDEQCVNNEYIPAGSSSAVLDVFVHREVCILRSGGIEIRGLYASAIPRRKPLGEPVIEKYQFVPNNNESRVEDATMDVQEIVRICVHVGLENQQSISVKVVELFDEETDKDKALLVTAVAQVLEDLPLIHADIKVLSAAGESPLTMDLGHGIAVEDKKLSTETNCMFVLGTNLLSRPVVLQQVLSCVGTTGYLISREKTAPAIDQLVELTVLNRYTVGDETIVLLKKSAAPSANVVITIKQDDYSWIGQLQEALKQQKSVSTILMVAQGEPNNGILGLFNCIRKEPGGDRARCYFILDESAAAFDPELPLYKQQIELNLALNVYRDGRWGSYRHLELKECPLIGVKHAVCKATVRGDLSSFKWQEGPLDPDTFKAEPRTKLVQVYMSALNFRDVMTATGKLAAEVIAKGRQKLDCVQGLEFSGRDMNGRRVMGKVPAGAMANLVCADEDLLWDVPDHWSLEDAATVPVVYGTAYYALTLSGRMKKGDTVLIHAGSGGVGQAAINIALFEGCTVYTTVGTQEKRDFIKKMWPQLSDRHIGNSRDTSFEQLIMTETNGRGVDLVLNSLAEEKLQASVRCLAVGGRFLEIGKFDLANNNPLGMEIFLKETSFHGIMLDNLFHAPSEWKKPIYNILAKGILDGAVKPLSRTVFSDLEVEQAFRFMAAGKHIGKVVLKIRPEEEQLTIVPKIILMQAVPRFFCNPEHTYIIAGGLGGFGLELADWIVFRGARKIVLTSRTGMKTGYQSSRVRIMKSYGTTVVISTADISSEEGVTALLTEANKLGPVGGIFNLAVVLLDALFENQTVEDFIKSAGPKATATAHLDVISRRLCPELTYFVIFSSVSCGRGNAGQTNYGMSNSVMERICERRVRDGYPGLAVQWGAVGEVGLVAEMQEEQHELVIGGTLQQRITSCLEVLDSLLRQSNPVVASMVVAEKRAGSGGAGNIVDCVVNILGLRDLKTVSLHSTLAELGMDSMMAVEIKQTLEREFEVFLSPQDIRGLTFAKLEELSNAALDDTKMKPTVSALNVDAIQFMIQAIGEEEDASRPVTELPSLVGENDAPVIQPTMFVVPGIEGMASVLAPLAKNLKSKVTGLQLGYEKSVGSTTKEMAQSLLPYVKGMLAPNAPFNLLGYSFGGLVALELVLLLENAGHEGKLFLVDGSPDFLQEICKNQLVDGTEDNLQVNLLMVIINILKKQDVSVVDKIRADLLALGTWSERVNHFLDLLPESKYSIEYRRSIAYSTLKRILSVINFKWSETDKVKTKVTLLRPNQLSAHSSPDQGLSKYCSNLVDVHFIDGDHVSILESPTTAGIINNQVANFVEDQLTRSNQTRGKPSITRIPQLFKGPSRLHTIN